MKKINLFVAATALAFSSMVSAQIKTPQPSPTASIEQMVGLTEVEIEYSRPGVKGRTIFGDLLPFGEIWRTGANSATLIEVSDDVKIGGQAVPAGQYALYTIPGAEEWTVIIHKHLENWGAGGYDKTQDLCRFMVKPTKLNDKVESFTIDFSNFTTNSANIELKWENTMISFLMETPTDAAVEKQIKSQLVDQPAAGTYYSAASYYLEKGENLDKADVWIDKAISQRPEAFWYVHAKAKIQAAQGKTKEAVVTAEKSMALAKAAEDDYGYVKNNENLIKELKAKKK
ncbi:MAG: hypothetical protein ACI9XP_000207 [Lentimonas sp.]|jgi:hypothetical protein